jgi:hypothetical protein
VRPLRRGEVAGKGNPFLVLADRGVEVRSPLGEDEIRRRDLVLTTNCCREKLARRDPADHREIYLGRIQRRTHEYARLRGIPSGTLNAYNGIFFDGDPVPPYDIHPSQLDDARLVELGRNIGRRCRSRGVPGVAYYQSTPYFAMPYLVMLSYSGIPFVYASRLS